MIGLIGEDTKYFIWEYSAAYLPNTHRQGTPDLAFRVLYESINKLRLCQKGYIPREYLKQFKSRKEALKTYIETFVIEVL